MAETKPLSSIFQGMITIMRTKPKFLIYSDFSHLAKSILKGHSSRLSRILAYGEKWVDTSD